ncbi:Putative TPR repeat-containing peptidase [Candidatus Deianiraea vastatrix]|uniref:TPR repeat-containing peptidase n=2 Tax=Candidatus Deianiraea vastatrix TaxID=2163644 RepID=A0A5B8XDV9_9RICK|nr:Putative TPR repeat-containing peptidase [Candidatus Deianiraea vastatrix]
MPCKIRIKNLVRRVLLLVFFYQFTINCFAVSVIRDVEVEFFLQDLTNPLLAVETGVKLNLDNKNNLASKTDKPSPIYKPTFAYYTRPVPVYKAPESKQTFNTVSTLAFKTQKKGGVRKVEFFLVNDDSINAFVSGGSKIFVNTGLLACYKNSNLTRGVLAHELGHIINSHLVRGQIDRSQAAKDGVVAASLIGLFTIATGGIGAMAAGAAPGIAASSAATSGAIAATGIGAIAAGSSIAQQSMMSYSRAYETEADNIGIRLLDFSGNSSKGLLELMRYFDSKMGNVPELSKYFMTHPLPKDRLTWMERAANSQDLTTLKIDSDIEDKFQRVRAKILGFLKKSSFTEINTSISGVPSVLSNNALFYQLYKEMFSNLADGNYSAVIESGKDLLKMRPNDIYVSETMAQSYCAIGEIDLAKYYFNIIRSKVRNNSILEFEYGQCLAKYGKNQSDINDGIAILYAITLIYTDNIESRQMLVDIAKEKNIAGLFALMSAEIAIINGDRQNAKAILKDAIDNNYMEYRNEISNLYATL